MSDLSPLSGEERKSNFGAVRSVFDSQLGHGPMSDLSPLSGGERKSNFGAVRSVDDPEPTLDFASHNTKKRHSRPARGGMAEVVTTMHLFDLTHISRCRCPAQDRT